LTLQAYRFALDPTPTQVRNMASHCGAARVAYNWGLGRVKAVLGQREAEATYGVSQEDLTPAVSWSLYCLRKEWNTAKAEVAPWWGECSKEAFNTGLDGLARALKNWDDSRSGKRKGAPVGFPGSSPSTAAGSASGSPQGRSGARPNMRSCPGWAGSRCMRTHPGLSGASMLGLRG
jgi:transposase